MKDVEHWLHEKAALAYDALKADRPAPSRPTRYALASHLNTRKRNELPRRFLPMRPKSSCSWGKNNNLLILLTRVAAHDAKTLAWLDEASR